MAVSEKTIKELQEQVYIPDASKMLPRQAKNRTAELLAEAALRHARREKAPREIEAAKEALKFFQENPNTSFITREQRESLYELISTGLSVRKAVVLANIDWWTFKAWRRLGGYKAYTNTSGNTEVPNLGVAPEPFRSFVIGLYQAEANCQRNALVKLAATDDWRAVAWLLERRFPDGWGKPKEGKSLQQQASQSTVNIVIPDNNRQNPNGPQIVEVTHNGGPNTAVKADSRSVIDIGSETSIEDEGGVDDAFVASAVEAAFTNADGLDDQDSIFMQGADIDEGEFNYDAALIEAVRQREEEERQLAREEASATEPRNRRNTVASRRKQKE